jgi:hypothetical protein
MAQPPPASTIHAEIGNVTNGSQVAVGNNILQVRELHGDLVYQQTGKPAPPRLRTQPVSLRPRAFPSLLDRETETSVTLIELGARRSVECSGEAGSGKTSFLRHIAHQRELDAFGAGVLYFQVNRQSTADLLKSLFDAFYETDIPLKPTETELRVHLGDLSALVLLDDVDGEGDAKVIESLMNVATGCTFLSATAKRIPHGETQALTLRGLPNPDAVTLFERELGRPLSAMEREAAERLCESLGCVPQRILFAANQVRERKDFLNAIALVPKTVLADSLAAAEIETRSEDERKVLAALAVFVGAPVAAQHIEAIADVPGSHGVLATLETRGLVSSHEGRYMLSSVIGKTLDANLDGVRKKALAHFQAWTQNGSLTPVEITHAAEPALMLARWGMQAGLHSEAAGVARAMQSSLALTGKWDMWAESLQVILSAARAGESRSDECWALHQLGTRALCLNAASEAKDLLEHALNIRNSIGDVPGAEATRHNLKLIRAAPTTGDSESSRGSPTRPKPLRGRFGAAVAGTALVAATLVALVLLWPDSNSTPAGEIATVDSGASVTASATPVDTTTPADIDTSAVTNIDEEVPPPPPPLPLPPPPLPLPQIVAFKASPAAIRAGESAQLCFALKDAVAVQIEGRLARRDVIDESTCVDVTPQKSMTYTLTAFNAEGAAAVGNTLIEVVAAEPDSPARRPGLPDSPVVRATILRFGPDSQVIARGGKANLCFTVAGRGIAALAPDAQSFRTPVSRCVAVQPAKTTRYTLTVRSPGRQDTSKTAIVGVTSPNIILRGLDRRR